MLAVFNEGSGRNSATDRKFPEYVLQDREFEASLDIVAKDARLAAELGVDEGLAPLLRGTVERLASDARAACGGEADLTRIYHFVEERTQVGETPPSNEVMGREAGSSGIAVIVRPRVGLTNGAAP